MIRTIAEHIEQIAAQAGSRGFETSEDAIERVRTTPFVAFLPDRESWQKDGTVVAEETDATAMIKSKRLRHFDRQIRIRLVLIADSVYAADEFLQEFVPNIPRSIRDDAGNDVEIEVSGGEWISTSGLLKGSAGISVYLDCDGGMYSDADIPLVGVGTIDLEFDTGGESGE